jgi:ubiquinone biosynthesis protein
MMMAAIPQLIPIETLVPEIAGRWRPLVRDAFEFFFSHLSHERLGPKIAEQLALPVETPPEIRLIRLISKIPGLQKLGQVLARNPRLAPGLRSALIGLENGMSDVSAEEITGIIRERLAAQLEAYSVQLDASILGEASVSAVMRFTWKKRGRERERAVFKVMKPYIPDYYSEDMTLLQQLGDYLAAKDRGYGFAVRDVKEMLAEVRLLLEHELDFTREQATLIEARRTYRASIGIRVPALIRPLCTRDITAMSEERGVKVTEAFRRSPIRRNRIARQIIEGLIAVPLFSREQQAVFHGDPHAGNLFYDEPNRELVIFDWALADRLDLETRRRLVLLVLMTIFRDQDAVVEAVNGLTLGPGRRRTRDRIVRRCVKAFFESLPPDYSPGALDAMRVLDDVALEGVRFPASLFLFRKMLFTLDGVLEDIAGSEVRIDRMVARDFLTRWLSSFGFFHAPLHTKDFVKLEWKAVVNQARALQKKLTPGA